MHTMSGTGCIVHTTMGPGFVAALSDGAFFKPKTLGFGAGGGSVVARPAWPYGLLALSEVVPSPLLLPFFVPKAT